MFVNTKTGATYNFVAPEGLPAGIYEVLFPANKLTALEFAAEMTVEITQKMEVIIIDMTDDAELAATFHEQLANEVTDVILIVSADSSERTLSFDGTTTIGGPIVVPANNTSMLLCKCFKGMLALVSKFNNLGTVTIADNAVTTAKIAADAVTNDKIGDAAIKALQINENAVETAKIKDAAVTLAKLAPGTAAGDILYYNGTEWVILPKGTEGQVLKIVSGAIVWGPDAIT